uniref:Membrane protein n=1 Tax=Infectious bronchitis virus TaxID=11120 RepID=O12402_9GAMC|nr:membrane protein [Infectious bronchitis virus]AAC57883.1 membrane protein [Infectious bronchitis virus]
MNDTMNCTLNTQQQAAELFKEYNVFVTAFLLFLSILLQYGYATRSRFIYILKMILLWCFWPLNIAVGVISCIFPPNTGGSFVAAIILTVCGCLVFFLGYWIQSIRLFKRGRSWGAIKPRSYAGGPILLTNGQQCNFAIESVPVVLSPIIKNGVLYCEGQWLAKCEPDHLPKDIFVCTPDRRNIYRMVQKYTGDQSGNKKRFATFVYAKQSVDTGELESVATGGSSLYT